LADYFDPANAEEAYARIEHAALNPDYVATQAERNRREFRPVRWTEAFDALIAALETRFGAEPMQVLPPPGARRARSAAE
jgi:hypothetical protein